MFKIGIIGCGKIAQVRHIPEYAMIEDAILAGFYDINLERAEELAKKYGGKAYATCEELINDGDIDAVSICTANHAHAKVTIQALEAGKHVLCEKPMATSLEECEEMVEVAKKVDRLLLIGHNQRLAKAHKKAKELILEGAIGKIISFQTTFLHGGPETWSIDSGKNVWFFDKDKASLGAMADLGIHKTDLIQFLTGEKIVKVMANLSTLDKVDQYGNKISVDDNAFCIYTMESGIVGTMRVGWTCYGKEDNSTILYGSEGVMKIYCDKDYAIIIDTKDGSTIKYDIDQIQTNDNQTNSGVIELFVECLRKGKSSTISGEEALSAMKAVFACEVSSVKGRSIKVK